MGAISAQVPGRPFGQNVHFWTLGEVHISLSGFYGFALRVIDRALVQIAVSSLGARIRPMPLSRGARPSRRGE